MAEAALYCAHRTCTFLSCAFCDKKGTWPLLLILPLQSAVEGVPREELKREAAQSVAVSYQAWSIFIPHALARPTIKTPMKSGWVCPFAMARLHFA